MTDDIFLAKEFRNSLDQVWDEFGSFLERLKSDDKFPSHTDAYIIMSDLKAMREKAFKIQAVLAQLEAETAK